MPHLDFFVNQKLFLRVSLGAESITIGRGADCEVQLTDDRVSRAHARITSDAGAGWFIENLSPNGTRLNSAMIEDRMGLAEGDRFYIADYVMIYHPDDAPKVQSPADATRGFTRPNWAPDRKGS